MIHELKCWPEYFVAMARGHKCFEFRKDDRGFSVGDHLKLMEWCPKTKTYSGQSRIRQICYILRDREGLTENYVVLGL